MPLDRIENTSLWRGSLAPQKKDAFSTKRDELRSSFVKFRDNVSHLVSHISAALPNLTQHDISHLDGLWETASLIAGETYPLNPLEAFVLGGSILLHDSALCFEAYDKGVNGIRDTVVWKDAYAAAIEIDKHTSEDEWQRVADFMTLRQLHADQSATLIERGWVDPDNGEILYLIENFTLRKHLGQLIGEISASHHWDIEKVSTAFSSQINALASFPREWRIDPIKIACLLRCADATHIDNERAPDFLYALVRRQGISFDHWQAQNRLASVDLDQSDANVTSLIFTSTRNFTERESNSWWVAYDAACLIDQEIRSSNAVLEAHQSNSIKPFKAKKVKGVESPELMTNYIKVEGWSPCSAKIHVGNVEKLVKNLGGEQLYGHSSDQDLFQITVRELVQNARDSVQARSVIDKHFQGKITIKIYSQDSSFWLTVEDNGVGMSERVLTGPLLDFGTSFWTSSLVQSEFPGLRSSKFRAVGRFGIGFYSTFMTASEVYVVSRLWKHGIIDAKQLQFKNGISFRPILKNGPSDDFNTLISTQIKLKLKNSILEDGYTKQITRNLIGASNLTVDLSDYLSAICSGLDVSVYFSQNHGNELLIHKSVLDNNFNSQEWLEQMSFSKYQEENVGLYIKYNMARLRPIKENGILLGMAAISTLSRDSQNFLSVRTIGGLATSVHNRDSSFFIGYLDCLPKSAKREANFDYAASEITMQDWARDQMNILLQIPLGPIEKYIAAINISQFKVDPSPIASIVVFFNRVQHFMTIAEIAQLAQSTDIIIFKSRALDFADIHNTVQNVDGYAVIKSVSGGNFMSLKMKNDVPEDNYSLIACIHRMIITNGNNPTWRIAETDATDTYGMTLEALILSLK